MKHIIKPGTLILAVTLVFGLVAACSSPAPQVTSKPAASSAPVPDVFKTSTLTINPSEAYAGVQIMITAKVTNTGSAATTYTPKLRIDNVSNVALPTFLYLRDATIAPGATQQMSFVVSPDNPGKYRVTWNELAGEFNVVENAAYAGNATAAAPDFTGVDVVTGKKIALSQFKGSTVLFNFVNYGCDPSVNSVVSAQLLAIRELQKQRKDFVPVSVFCGCCPPDVLRNFAKQNNLSWPWILDTDNSIARKYMTYLRKYGYPTLVFIDEGGVIRDSAGYTQVSGLSEKLDKLVGQKG
ncbi:MAG: redoxin domain-containing protein [Dehalococcoidales bacterium]|nr:redoxin domain-containing protein [Dehalococcoidales bacterium]